MGKLQVHLVRHGFAGDDGDDTDPDRELTDEGREIVEQLAEAIKESGDVPVAIYASPSVRAQETAEILRDGLGLSDVKTVDSIGPRQSIRPLLLKLCESGADNVMIVTHHDTMAHGLMGMDGDNAYHTDVPAMGELRKVSIKRKSGKWKETDRIKPSDRGLSDHF